MIFNPVKGDIIVPQELYNVHNPTLSELLKIVPGEPLKVLEVFYLNDELGFGVTKVEKSSGEIIDLKDYPELKEYWCIFLSTDFIRLIKQ